MSPRPLLLAGLCTALAVASWLTADSAPLAEATSWHVGEELISRPRGADARVATIERLMADTPSSASSRVRLHDLLSGLADERLVSLRGIDRRSDPSGARAALGPELDDFITSPDPGRTAVPVDRMSLLLNRIESL